MIRFLLRLASLLLLALAFASVVIDGTRSIAAGSIVLTSFGDACARMFPEKFPQLGPTILAHFPDWVWNPALADLLRLPTWVVLAAIGLVLSRLARKPRPPIGYSSRD